MPNNISTIGSSGGSGGLSTNIELLTADRVLIESDANILQFSTEFDDVIVTLPDPSLVPVGKFYDIRLDNKLSVSFNKITVENHFNEAVVDLFDIRDEFNRVICLNDGIDWVYTFFKKDLPPLYVSGGINGWENTGGTTQLSPINLYVNNVNKALSLEDDSACRLFLSTYELAPPALLSGVCYLGMGDGTVHRVARIEFCAMFPIPSYIAFPSPDVFRMTWNFSSFGSGITLSVETLNDVELLGTTGTDTFLIFSYKNGYFYIENRLGIPIVLTFDAKLNVYPNPVP